MRLRSRRLTGPFSPHRFFAHKCSFAPALALALAREYVSSGPTYDPEVWGEDGQSADYLFVFLRSILAVIENAQAEGLWAVHELSF